MDEIGYLVSRCRSQILPSSVLLLKFEPQHHTLRGFRRHEQKIILATKHYLVFYRHLVLHGCNADLEIRPEDRLRSPLHYMDCNRLIDERKLYARSLKIFLLSNSIDYPCIDFSVLLLILGQHRQL